MLSYKRHARSRGFQFNLNRDLVGKIIEKPCFYCGTPPSNFMKTKNSINGLYYNSIDRVDSNGDYTENNVVPACKMCNNAKSNHTIGQFKSWVLRLASMANQWG